MTPAMHTILLVSPYWKEQHRWMVSSVKLAELWQRLGYRLVVVCMSSVSGVEEVSPTLTIYRRRDFFLPDPLNFGISVGFSRFVRRIVHAERPDLIVVNKVLFWTSFAMIPLRLRGYRFLLLTDALVGMTWWPRNVVPKIIMGMGAWTMGWIVLLCAERVVFFHPQPEKLLRRLRVWKKSQVIPTGIDIGKFPGPRPQAPVRGPESLRAEWPGPRPQVVTVTYVGRLESVKGADDFVEAVVPLKKQFSMLTIHVVGWYKDGHPLVQKFKDEVVFTGLRDDIPAILAVTDIFVMPSYSEGLSNAIMEAMASRCACIVSDVGGNRFLVQNGVSGLLFPPGDREALKAHVRRLIEDPTKRRMLGEAARRRIEETFSWEKVGEEYRKLFQELAV